MIYLAIVILTMNLLHKRHQLEAKFPGQTRRGRCVCPALVALLLLLALPAQGQNNPDGGPYSSDGSPESGARPEEQGPAAGRAMGPSSPAPRVITVREQLLQAIKHYQQSEFDEAFRLLDDLIKAVGDDRSRVAEEAFIYLAYVQLAFGQEEAAVQAFERALIIHSELRLDAPSPKVAAALEQARRRYRAKIRALDHDPPTQEHVPPAAAPAGRSLLISTIVRDVSGVERVVLSYRTKGQRGYASVIMEREPRRGYIATIPGPVVTRPGVEYYLQSWDQLGNGPGLKGSATAPIVIVIEGGPRSTASKASRPWYKQWWFWAVVSSVAVTAGTIGAAAYFGREESARFDLRLSKDLNP